MVKIAVCSKDLEEVTGHAGQVKNWLLFETPEEGEWAAREVALPRPQVFHHYSGEEPHPLDGVSALIAMSAGEVTVPTSRVRPSRAPSASCSASFGICPQSIRRGEGAQRIGCASHPQAGRVSGCAGGSRSR